MSIIKTSYKVSVDGNDITTMISGGCENISYSKSAGSANDTCSITIADPFGLIKIPQKRKTLEIEINDDIVFRGFVDDTDYDFNDGKKLIVLGNSIDAGGKIKEPDLKTKDDASFEDVASEWGEAVGLKVSVSGSIKGLKRKFWMMQNESFHSWADHVSRTVGATYKTIGDQAFFVGRNEGLSASGKTLTPIEAVYGENLLGGNISPINTRAKYVEAGARYFDQNLGEYVVEKIKTAAEDVEATWFQPIASASKETAQQQNTSTGKDVEREQGSGQIKILGDSAAEPEAETTVSGLRVGIDGTYRADSINSTLDENGFVTSVGIKHPKGGAGVDKR